MRNRFFGCWLLFLIAALTVFAGKGLTPVAVQSGFVGWSEPLRAMDKQLTPAPADCGTVSPKALVAEFPIYQGKIRVAIDSDKADAAGFNRIRFDFTGTGKFTEENSVAMQISNAGASSYGQFGPANFTVQVAGRRIPVQARGSTCFAKNGNMLTLFFSNALQGGATFGRQVHAVRIVDANSNLHPGDKFPHFRLKDLLKNTVHPGDALVVDIGDGSFRKTVTQFFGQPIAVNGKWYTVGLSADTSALVVKPFAGKLGTMKLPGAKWQAWLLGSTYFLQLTGDRQPMTVPADSYQFLTYQETVPNAKGPGNATLYSGFSGNGKEPRIFAMQADKLTAPAIGSPIIARVQVTQRGRECTFSLSMTDRGGAMAGVDVPGSTGANQYSFAIYNARGHKIHTGVFQPG